MDEFGKKPVEFEKRRDEFCGIETLPGNADKKKTVSARKRKLLKALMSGTFVVTVTPALLGASDYNAITGNQQDNHESIIPAATDNLNVSDDKEQSAGTNDKDLTNETVIFYIDCDECQGTGVICKGDPNFGYDRGNGHGYEGCGGTGFRKCPDIWCDNGLKTCQSCEGSGIDHRGNQCVVCNGSGIVDCEFCHNTGIAECISADSHEECGRCSGTGKIAASE